MKKVYKALTIAGSDSGAGAGIQADLKTFAALGVYGTTVVTAVTAQSTVGIFKSLVLPTELIAAQIDAVAKDIGAQAVKTGMLANAAIVALVAKKIHEHRWVNLVVDPVLSAKGGAPLLSNDAVKTLCDLLLPLAAVVTPNLPEAERLTGIHLAGPRSIRKAAERILAMGPRSVVIKGGHRRGPATDFFYDGKRFREIAAHRIHTKNTHGTGCTFSAAIAANLARGMELENAVIQAKRYVTRAIQGSLDVGKGAGPLHHFYRFWK